MGKFFSGPADVTLWDGTNGFYLLGYLADVEIGSKVLTHTIIDGNLRRYAVNYRLRAAMLQSAEEAITEINSTRDGTRQNIYLTKFDGLAVMSNVFAAAGHSINGREDDIVEVTAAGYNTVTKYKNLLGADGKFEVDSNSDGVADGWTDGASAASIVASHLSGGGNAQRVNLALSGDNFYYEVKAPFETARRLAASVYAREHTGLGTLDFTFGFKTLDTAGAVINTYADTYNFSAGQAQRVTKEVFVNEGQPVASVRLFVEYAGSGGEIRMDNAQLELGPLSDFKDY
ncbi:MAG TPA: hypothetical protein ENK32_07835 [Anaerolineae bacterium]|nr:hypothetical protein [Anaerolineae bacterium]